MMSSLQPKCLGIYFFGIHRQIPRMLDLNKSSLIVDSRYYTPLRDTYHSVYIPCSLFFQSGAKIKAGIIYTSVTFN